MSQDIVKFWMVKFGDHQWFAKFTKVFLCQKFTLYSISDCMDFEKWIQIILVIWFAKTQHNGA